MKNINLLKRIAMIMLFVMLLCTFSACTVDSNNVSSNESVGGQVEVSLDDSSESPTQNESSNQIVDRLIRFEIDLNSITEIDSRFSKYYKAIVAELIQITDGHLLP